MEPRSTSRTSTSTRAGSRSRPPTRRRRRSCSRRSTSTRSTRPGSPRWSTWAPTTPTTPSKVIIPTRFGPGGADAEAARLQVSRRRPASGDTSTMWLSLARNARPLPRGAAGRHLRDLLPDVRQRRRESPRPCSGLSARRRRTSRRRSPSSGSTGRCSSSTGTGCRGAVSGDLGQSFYTGESVTSGAVQPSAGHARSRHHHAAPDGHPQRRSSE